MKQDKIKISVVDDDQHYLDTIKMIIDNDKSFRFYCEYTSGQEFINSLKSPFQPDVVLIDIFLGDISGVQCCKIAKSLFPEMQLILMTGAPTAESIQQSEKIGVDYIEKGLRSEYFLKNIIESNVKYQKERIVSVSKFSIATEEEIQILDQLRKSKENLSNLKGMQLNCLLLKSRGFTEEEIAVKLNVTRGTVSKHLNRANAKLNLPNLLDYLTDDL